MLFMSYRHQGLGVLGVALASHGVTLMASLVEDLQVEGLSLVSVVDFHIWMIL